MIFFGLIVCCYYSCYLLLFLLLFIIIILCYLDDFSHQVNTILAEGRRLIVGTLDGLVAIFDSETRVVLSRFNWHEEKVRSLLLLPEQIRPSICAEVGISSTKSSSKDTPSSTNSGKPKTEQSLTTNTSDEEPHLKNELFLPNSTAETPLIASIGNGRRRMKIDEKIRQKGRGITRYSEDITLLIWHS